MFGRSKKKGDTGKLKLWQDRYARNKTAYERELSKMDRREALYLGSKDIKAPELDGKTRKAAHVRNIVAELVESQVSSTIPQPKVTALRPQDEGKARLIEDMLRNQMDRLPMEYNNDQEERTVPIQGGALSLVEWDSTQRTHATAGELCVSHVHPKRVVPQDGVYSDLEDMDYFFVLAPQTKKYIKDRYGVDVSDESEEHPEIRGADSDQSAGEDLVTQILAYYRNRKGGIGLYSWVMDKELEDLEDYQARRVYTCSKCGQRGDGETCAYCGSTSFTASEETEETLAEDIQCTDGRVIPAMSPVLDERGMPMVEEMTDGAGNPVLQPMTDGQGMPLIDQVGNPVVERVLEPVMEPTKIPLYKPDIYPLILRKNVSIFGRFLGDSDVDKIEDQQETIKKIETKVIEKLFKGGSVLTVPEDTLISFTDEELRIIRLKDATQKGMLGVYNLQPDVGGDLSYMSLVYEEARQTIGITDSYQGRQDSTATSGVAKEFAARQSAGRLESKRAMKDAAYARLFEAMFKFMLAYSDEPRTVVSSDNQGHRKYDTFYRYDFLEQDEAGEWYWNDRFLFSVDASATLANNREALWQEARMNFQQGCFGDPSSLEALVVFWTRMDDLHYPGASDNKTYFEDKLQTQQQAQAMAQQQMAAQAALQGAVAGTQTGAGTGVPAGTMEAAGQQAAQQIAAQDAQQQSQAAMINGGGRL